MKYDYQNVTALFEEAKVQDDPLAFLESWEEPTATRESFKGSDMEGHLNNCIGRLLAAGLAYCPVKEESQLEPHLRVYHDVLIEANIHDGALFKEGYVAMLNSSFRDYLDSKKEGVALVYPDPASILGLVLAQRKADLYHVKAWLGTMGKAIIRDRENERQ